MPVCASLTSLINGVIKEVKCYLCCPLIRLIRSHGRLPGTEHHSFYGRGDGPISGMRTGFAMNIGQLRDC
jgi:hypothetical protein